MSAAREAVLARVRAALADRPRPDAPPQVPRPAVVADPVALFAERVGEYRATVHEVAPAAVATAIAAICAEHGARRLAVPSDLPGGWLPAGIETLPDPDVAVLDGLDGVITGCAAAIAETGTIVLDAGAGQGRRALTLVPDLHICVVAAGDIVVGVEGAVTDAAAAVRGRRAPLTLISGPSATSDIELSRVEGVHGPRRLEVVIVI